MLGFCHKSVYTLPAAGSLYRNSARQILFLVSSQAYISHRRSRNHFGPKILGWPCKQQANYLADAEQEHSSSLYIMVSDCSDPCIHISHLFIATSYLYWRRSSPEDIYDRTFWIENISQEEVVQTIEIVF